MEPPLFKYTYKFYSNDSKSIVDVDKVPKWVEEAGKNGITELTYDSGNSYYTYLISKEPLTLEEKLLWWKKKLFSTKNVMTDEETKTKLVEWVEKYESSSEVSREEP